MPWLRHFALFVVFVTALFRPAAAGAFVSAPDANAQARVGAFELVVATLVGPASGATCGLYEGIGAAYDENASGYRFAAGGAPKALPAPRVRGNPNPIGEHGTFHVDPKGNVVPTPPGGRITGSPDGRFIQARDAAGNPTGVRIDGPHRPATHPDPRAQQPHGHVPGVTNPDGTPWLPINQ
ncbi:MAG: hypothetical protein IT303_02835 [Dehalococcoidia bacterium]|nr:hypothetical protein [Dehalococcoidia bacterium]